MLHLLKVFLRILIKLINVKLSHTRSTFAIFCLVFVLFCFLTETCRFLVTCFLGHISSHLVGVLEVLTNQQRSVYNP